MSSRHGPDGAVRTRKNRPISTSCRLFGAKIRAPARVGRSAGHKKRLTLLRAIAIAIAHETTRRSPALRRPDVGATYWRSVVLRPRTSAQVPDERGARATARRNAGNRPRPGIRGHRVGRFDGGGIGRGCATAETRPPRTDSRARRWRRGWNELPQPAARFRHRGAEPGAARPAGERRELARPAAGRVFRCPTGDAVRVHCLAPRVSTGARPQGMRYRVRWECAPCTAARMFQWEPSANLTRCRPAFSPARLSLIAGGRGK